MAPFSGELYGEPSLPDRIRDRFSNFNSPAGRLCTVIALPFPLPFSPILRKRFFHAFFEEEEEEEEAFEQNLNLGAPWIITVKIQS